MNKTFKYRLRLLQKDNSFGDVIGITLPRELFFNGKILNECLGTKFYITTSGTSIILSSGAEVQTMTNKDLNTLVIKKEKFII